MSGTAKLAKSAKSATLGPRSSVFIKKSGGGNESEEKEKFFDARSSSENRETVCNAESTIIGTIINLSLINPIFQRACKDLNAKKFQWDSFNTIGAEVSLANWLKLLIPAKKNIIKQICYMLVPYTTFFPLNINQYMLDNIKFIKDNKDVFNEIITTYENRLIDSYKRNKKYNDPLCPPIQVMNYVISEEKVD